jgi:hypothetical protein
MLINSPAPWARQRIYNHVLHTPPERIQKIVILSAAPGQSPELAHSDIVVEDAQRIRQISAILDAAREVSPNHPHTRWTARVKMVTLDGTYYFTIRATAPGDSNGTLVSPSAGPEGGWNLGDVRADGLERILEEAASGSGTR